MPSTGFAQKAPLCDFIDQRVLFQWTVGAEKGSSLEISIVHNVSMENNNYANLFFMIKTHNLY